MLIRIPSLPSILSAAGPTCATALIPWLSSLRTGITCRCLFRAPSSFSAAGGPTSYKDWSGKATVFSSSPNVWMKAISHGAQFFRNQKTLSKTIRLAHGWFQYRSPDQAQPSRQTGLTLCTKRKFFSHLFFISFQCLHGRVQPCLPMFLTAFAPLAGPFLFSLTSAYTVPPAGLKARLIHGHSAQSQNTAKWHLYGIYAMIIPSGKGEMGWILQNLLPNSSIR